MIADRIDVLLDRSGFPELSIAKKAGSLHDLLDAIDGAVGVDTKWKDGLRGCECVTHINKSCDSRRAVGARVALLEARLAHRRCAESWRAAYHQCGLAPGFMI
jgi:hypothetical protein